MNQRVLKYGLACICMLFLFAQGAFAQQIEYLEAKPLSERISVSLQPVRESGEFSLPLITWGGDVATIFTQMEGIFDRHDVAVRLEHEDKFKNQVEACLRGDTPYLRGTIGMINGAAEAFKKHGVDMVPIYLLTRSVGGDVLVVREHIKKLGDLRGKTDALQLDGPHMDYIADILRNANVPPSSMKFKWLQELMLPTYDTGGKIIDPVSAFQADPSIDAVMCIIPDALMLTSGGKVGTGSDNSVKGARIMLTTKTADHVIFDVYAVRSDYLNSNRNKVESLVRALHEGQEKWVELMKNKSSQPAKHQQVLSRSADLLLGSPTATADVEALLGDCAFSGFQGNVAFFTGKGTTRNLESVSQEIQTSFLEMGLVRTKVAVKNPNWDWAALAQGLAHANYQASSAPATPKFDTKKVTAVIEKQIAAEPTAWEEEGTLFVVEIYFAPNQDDFSEARYASDFQEALKKAQTYGGALITVEGHADPTGVLRARKKARETGSPVDLATVSQIEQQARNLSMGRSQAVRASFVQYCKSRGFQIDDSQFVPVGMGVKSPKYSPPRTEEEWNANRRVVFRVKQVEAELTKFIPID